MEITVKANNLSLYAETFGDRTHPAVLLIMGMGSQCLNWFPYFYEPIVEQGYYVIRFDNRDIGLSEWIDPLAWRSKPYSLEDMAKDAVELLTALEIDKAHIVGVSMGGAIAQRIAISHSDRVLSLTCLLSFADATTLTSNLELPSTTTDETPSLEMQLSSWRMLAGSGYPFDEELYKELYHEGFEVRKGYNPNCIQHQLAAISISGSRLGELNKIIAPTLVVHGKEDALVPVNSASKYASKIPGAKLLLLDGVGHEIPQGASDRILQEMFNLFATDKEISHVR